MIERIKKLLSDCKEIDDFKIVENKIDSSELFFVKKGLDMNRAKNVHHFNIVVYKNFEDDGEKYTGSSSAKIHPTMTDEEIKEVIDEVAFASGFIKNKYYPMVEPSALVQPVISSNFSDKALNELMPTLTEALYKSDNCDKGCINSSEVFINKINTRIVNSKGLDVSFISYKGEIEFITNWKEDGEEIELYKDMNFSDMDSDMIDENVKEMLNRSREKAIAKSTPALGEHNVLLSGSPVREVLSYYLTKASAKGVYNGVSTAKIGENIQGEDVKGDLISLSLDPFMKNSTKSCPYDSDGFPLKTVSIYEKGILNKYHGDVRHSYYLNIEPTGNIGNVIFEGGKYSADDFKKEPYLEIVAFSDFQMDSLTGNFGGEIRLGWYFDGTKTIPVTGGSISGNINEMHKEMYLSKEIQKDDNFIGPKTIKLLNVSVAGIE